MRHFFLIIIIFIQMNSTAASKYKFFFTELIKQDTLSKMDQDSIMMKEILIQKQDIKVNKGEITYDVWSSKFKEGFQSIDILKRMPFVFITDHDISIKNQGNVIVYINNIKVNLEGKDLIEYLETIPTDKIKKITISGNNSSKLDSMVGGVIYITLKKNKNELGYSINSSVSQKKYTNYSNNFLANYNKNNISLRYGINLLNNSTISDQKSEFSGIKDQSFNTFSKIDRNKISQNLDFDFQINKNLNMGFNYNFILNKPNVFNNNEFKTDVLYDEENYSKKENIKNHILLIHSTYKIDSLGSNISINTTYFKQNLVDNNMFYGLDFLDYSTHTRINNYDTKLDIHLKRKQIYYEFGAKFNLTRNIYKLEESFDFRENLYSFYVSTGFKIIEPIDINLGLRYESYNYEITGDLIDRSFLVPNLIISYANNQNVLSLSYNKRIIRPYFVYLNPYKLYTSSGSFIQGSPGLSPSIYQNLNLSYSLKNKFFFNFYYSDMKKLVSSNNKLNDGLIEKKYINDSDLKVLGATLNILVSPFHWLNSQVLLDGLYSYSNMYDKEAISKDGFAFNFYLNTDLKISKKLLFSTSFSYVPSSNSLNVIYKSESSLSFAVKGSLVKEKLTYRIFANDVFKQARKDKNIYFRDYVNLVYNYYDSRSIGVSFNYKFGGKIKSKSSTIAVDRVEI